jgi:hypothetical protein
VSESVLYLEFPVAQEWEAVDTLRRSLFSTVALAWGDRDGAERLAMVAAELLENAVKFGHWSAKESREGLATLRVVSDARTVTVTVTNPVDPERPGVRELLARLHGLDERSPEEVYLGRLRALAAEPAGTAGGLGLARVAYEAGCRLSAEVMAGGVLRVRAVMRL